MSDFDTFWRSENEQELAEDEARYRAEQEGVDD